MRKSQRLFRILQVGMFLSFFNYRLSNFTSSFGNNYRSFCVPNLIFKSYSKVCWVCNYCSSFFKVINRRCFFSTFCCSFGLKFSYFLFDFRLSVSLFVFVFEVLIRHSKLLNIIILLVNHIYKSYKCENH